MLRYGLAVLWLCTGAALHDLTAQALPNLRPHQLGGWAEPLLVRTNLSTLTDVSIVFEEHDIYIGWAVLNDSNVDIPSTNRFFAQVLVDGQLLGATRRFSDGLAAQLWVWRDGDNIGKLPVGNHTLRLEIDLFMPRIAETSETDNTYERQITVVSSNGLPARLQNVRVAGGQFEFTVAGSPGRYTVERSLSLPSWTTIGQVTNVNGLVTFSAAPAGQGALYRVRKESN